MVQRFAPNVGKSGLFLPTKAMQPVGAEVKFELRLFDDTPVLVGLGRVKFVRPPEPPRARRPKLGELIAQATESGPVDSGGLVSVEGIDEATIDLGKVLARARALAAASGHGELDAELAALQDATASPIEISVEAASAELARQLGGAAV